MRTLCIGDNQRAHLAKLVDLIQSKQLNGSEAWRHSQSGAVKDFPKKQSTLGYDSIQRSRGAHLHKALRQSVQNHLFQRCADHAVLPPSCRPLLRLAWHIEQRTPKSKYGAHTFDLANLTVGCPLQSMER